MAQVFKRDKEFGTMPSDFDLETSSVHISLRTTSAKQSLSIGEHNAYADHMGDLNYVLHNSCHIKYSGRVVKSHGHLL